MLDCALRKIPEGSIENSPTIYRWGTLQVPTSVPLGRNECHAPGSRRPSGTALRGKTLVAIPAFKRLGYFHFVPAGTLWNAAAASTRAVNGPRKLVMNLFLRARRRRVLGLLAGETPALPLCCLPSIADSDQRKLARPPGLCEGPGDRARGWSGVSCDRSSLRRIGGDSTPPIRLVATSDRVSQFSSSAGSR